MADVRQASRFASSFIQGFSFVDQINQRNRAQAKLDERLKAEQEDRAFRRKRLEQIDTERTEDRQRAADLFERAENQEKLAGDAETELLKGPNADRNILLAGARFSTRTFDFLLKEMSREELVQAIQDSEGELPPTQTSGLNDAVTAGEPGAPAAPGTAAGSLLSPSRGRSSLQSVSVDTLSEFDEGAPGGFFSSPGAAGTRTVEQIEGALDAVGGASVGLAQGAANVARRASNAVFGTDFGPLAGDRASDISTSISISAEEFSDPSELAVLGDDPAAFEEARLRSIQAVTDLRETGAAAAAAAGVEKVSRLDELREGSRAERQAARDAEFIVTQRYESYFDGTQENAFRSLVAEDPVAGVVVYANDRATLQSASPNLATDIDAAMTLPFKAAEQEAILTIQSNAQGSPERAKASRDLQSYRITQKQMYEDYSPFKAAGIDDRGLPIGNGKLVGQLQQAIEDPNRPKNAEPFPQEQMRAALTVTDRIKNTRRATDKQVKAALIVMEGGLASGQDVLSLAMTGSWPSTAPAANFHQFKPGIPVFVENGDGNLKHVFTPPGAEKPKPILPNFFSQDNLEQFRAGIATRFPPGREGNDDLTSALEGILLINLDGIQEALDMTDPLAPNRLGQVYAAAVAIADAEDIPGIPWWLGDTEPSFAKLLSSPKFLAELALEHGIPLALNVEAVRNEDVRINNLRQALQVPGAFEPPLRRAAEQLSDDLLIKSLARLDALEKKGQELTARGE